MINKVKKIWIYKFNKDFPMKGYQVKTICEDQTTIFGYGSSQDAAITDLVDKVRSYYDSFESTSICNIAINSTNWNYKDA